MLSILSRPDEAGPPRRTDRVIRQGLLMDPERLRVTVQDGIVTLSGRPGTGQADRDIIEAVRHIEGAAVRDQLTPGGDRLHTTAS